MFLVTFSGIHVSSRLGKDDAWVYCSDVNTKELTSDCCFTDQGHGKKEFLIALIH